MTSNIGLPSVIVEFKQKASTAIQRGNTGIVALVLRDSKEQGLHMIKGAYDIPVNLSEDNKKYINLTNMESFWNHPLQVHWKCGILLTSSLLSEKGGDDYE